MARELVYYYKSAPLEAPLFEMHSIEEFALSDRYKLVCNGVSRPVYGTEYFSYSNVAVAADEDGVDVEIEVIGAFETVTLRPTSYGIVPKVEGQKISFHVDGKCKKISVELDGDLKSALFVLCAPYIEKPADTTIHYEKGKIYNVGHLELKPNDVVYVEEGSVVLGTINGTNCDNIKIVGNGVFCGSCWHEPNVNRRGFMVNLIRCNNVVIEGVSFVDGPCWVIVPTACKNVVVRNTASLSIVVTGDGIDINNSQDVLVEDCFFRSTDDCVCIKSGRWPDPSNVEDVKNVLVQRCVIWNAEPGNAIEIGYGLESAEVCNLTFRDCDIIHSEYEGNMGGAAMSIHQADAGWIHDIHYENIRVEQVDQKLFDIKLLECKYTWDQIRGKISDIYFKDIKYLNGGHPVSLIRGYEGRYSESRPENIHFDNIEILGKKCETVLDMHMVVELAHDIYVNGRREYIRPRF